MSDAHDDDPLGGSVSPPGPGEERKRFFERAVPEIVKRVLERAVESGVEKLTELSDKPESLRHFVSEMRLPKEILGDIYAQIDDTKTGLYRVVAKEIRDVLEHTQIADEIVKVLTKLSFEIKTEIRFVPNDRSAEKEREREDGEPVEGEGAEPPVRSRVKTEVTVTQDKRGPKGREDR